VCVRLAVDAERSASGWVGKKVRNSITLHR
jgi:hypothetical protein